MKLCVGALLLMSCCISVAGEQVADGVVYTDLHKTVKQGNEITLKCQFYGDPIAVYWMKGDDPDRSLDLISWVQGTFLSGSCLSSNLCALDGDDYSLIIREAQIADQGRYLCRISNYLGILIHNYTDVKIYAPPREPYPVIKQCVEAEPNIIPSAGTCSIRSDDPINITCMAFGYFPDVELFFLHGSERMTTMNTNEWTNDDGTKNKSISIKGSANDTAYVCVASAIPGSKGQETATITINFNSSPATTVVTVDRPSDNRTVEIVVPIASFLVVGVVISLAYSWWRHQHGRAGLERNDGEEINPMVPKQNTKVPGALKEPVNAEEIKKFVRRLTGQHLRRLAKCIGVNNEDSISNTVEENFGMLFDAESMIREWITNSKGSNFEKRRKLEDIFQSFGQKADFQQSNFLNNEFERIATYLSSSQVKELFGDGDDPQNAIRDFAEDWMAKNQKKKLRSNLHTMLKPIGYRALIPCTLDCNVYLCEILDIAFRLILEDVYPLGKALGFSEEQLKKYRVDYSPDHLTKGTTAALIKFSENNNNDRKKVCEALSDAGYKNIGFLLEYGYETSLADEYAVVSVVGNDGEKLAKISENLGMSNKSNTVTVLKDWRAMVHPPSYNHRTSLADAVFPVLGKDVAVAILTGQYRENGSESSSVIQTICSSIESFEEPLITKILGLNDSEKLPDGQVITHSQGSSLLDERQGESEEAETLKTAIAVRIAQILGVTMDQETSIGEVLETWVEKIRENPLSKHDRKELSDNLLRAGLREFSFEIMTGFKAWSEKQNEHDKHNEV